MKSSTDWIRFGAGMLHLNKGSILKAEEIFNGILASSPSYGHAAAQLGFMKHDEGSIEAAKLFFDKALDKLPDDEMGFFHRGLIQTITRDYEEAEKSFLKVLELNPLRFDAILNYAGVIGRMGDFGKAEKIIDEAYRKDETRKNGFAWLGWIKTESHDWAGALEIMNRDYQVNRIDPWWVVNIALMFGRVGDWDKAAELIEDAYASANYLRDGFAMLGWIRSEGKDWNGAFEVMVLDREKNRLSAGWRHHLVLIQVFNGDHLGATKSVERWYSDDKCAADGYAHLGWTHYLQSTNKRKFLDFVAKDIEQNRLSSPEGKMIVAWSKGLRDELSSAVNLIDSLYKVNSSMKDGFAVMGWMQFEEGNSDKGIILMENDYRLQRLSPAWKINYAYQLLKMKQSNRAQAIFNEAMRLDPFCREIKIGYQILPEKILTKDQFLNELID